MVNEDGDQVGVMATKDALQMAADAGVDLVEVAPNAKPPVCRLMDYGKYQYQQQKRRQETKKKQVQIQLKEVKLRPKTDEHDLETKIKNTRRFLAKGDRVKVTVFFRGREIVHKEYGEELLKRFENELADEAKIEQAPKMEGRTMFMILSPISSK